MLRVRLYYGSVQDDIIRGLPSRRSRRGKRRHKDDIRRDMGSQHGGSGNNGHAGTSPKLV